MSRQLPVDPAADPALEATAVTCCVCGLQAAPAEGDPPLAWSAEHGEAGISWICPICTRDNVRAIEGKLRRDGWSPPPE